MKSKTSYSKKLWSGRLVRHNLRLYGLLSLLFTIFLWLVHPVRMLLDHERMLGMQEVGALYTEGMRILSFPNPVDGLLAFVVPVVMGLVLLRYLQEPSATAVYHSFPLGRSQILGSQILSGAVLFLGPLLLNALVMGGLVLWEGNGAWTEAIRWFAGYGTTGMMVFGFALMLGMALGSTLVQGVLVYVFLFLPVGLVLGVANILELLLHGYPYGESDVMKWTRISPVMALENMARDGNGWDRTMVQFLAYILLFFGMAFLLYRKRKLERNTDYLCFDSFKTGFVFLMTFLGMTLAGVYFKEMMYTRTSTHVGMAVGAVLAYAASQMIAQKSVFIHRTWKGMAVYGLAMTLTLTAISLDVGGYSRRIPNLGQVRSIQLTQQLLDTEGQLRSYGNWGSHYDPETGMPLPEGFNPILAIQEGNGAAGLKTYIAQEQEAYVTPEALQAIWELHFSRMSEADPVERGSRVVLEYRLENGGTLRRGYSFEYDAKVPELGRLFETLEYKRKNNPVLFLASQGLSKAVVNSPLGEPIGIRGQEAIGVLLDGIREDVLEETYESRWEEGGPFYFVDFYYPYTDLQGKTLESYVNVPVYSGYGRTREALDALGLLDRVVPTPGNVRSLAVLDRMGEDPYLEKMRSMEMPEAYEGLRKVEDKEKLALLLPQLQSNYRYTLAGDYYQVQVKALNAVGEEGLRTFYLRKEKLPRELLAEVND
ncbi:hypothetical protein [Anaerotalea alkaliphila]|uniref:ABC-2 type transport system permease protein n=1 Tax=Anaerotalea alkaliphila TaxID=2662126 RepID=A0A7X5KM01_9FIRM|nr:hypothetical protein [Anaerotalea alkaliphila]NDL66213.1 hypothetical protein [Anaerotalea alkaliphila]